MIPASRCACCFVLDGATGPPCGPCRRLSRGVKLLDGQHERLHRSVQNLIAEHARAHEEARTPPALRRTIDDIVASSRSLLDRLGRRHPGVAQAAADARQKKEARQPADLMKTGTITHDKRT